MSRSRNSLTGGTGDVNPQILCSSVTQTTADTTVVGTINLPISRLPTSNGSAIVIEILRVTFIVTNTSIPAGATVTQTRALTTNPSTTMTPAQTFVDQRAVAVRYDQLTVATSVGFIDQAEQTADIDLTDGAGHGLLVGTDNLYLYYNSTNTTAATTLTCRVLYRWKRVPLAEYIGIVQSQQ